MSVEPGLTDFSRVFGNGEFPWSGVWTISAPPGEIHDDLVAAWEMFPGPISRWALPVSAAARVWEVSHPSDWVRLVETFPTVTDEPHAGWELPGPNQHRKDVARLVSAPGQHAVRTAIDRQVLPDWTAVAREYDGVHLSWAGFLTTEGFVSDLPGRGVTMLRYWGSERTLWLRDVFGDPRPLGAPLLTGRVSQMLGADVTRDDDPRVAADLAEIATRLNRAPGRSVPGIG